MKVLVTGAAGFIDSALSIRHLDSGDELLGIDNHNDYYDPDLKEACLAIHENHSNYTHIRTGEPLGDDRFIRNAKKTLNRVLTKAKPGPKAK